MQVVQLVAGSYQEVVGSGLVEGGEMMQAEGASWVEGGAERIPAEAVRRCGMSLHQVETLEFPPAVLAAVCAGSELPVAAPRVVRSVG